MTRSGWWGRMALGLTVLTAACGSETPDAGERTTPIRRISRPENEFTPVELETVIDEVIDRQRQLADATTE